MNKASLSLSPMDERIDNVFYRTWQYISADALQLGRLSKKDAFWMCTDYIDRDGHDDEAVKAFGAMTEKQRVVVQKRVSKFLEVS
jgi:hypothetical protein